MKAFATWWIIGFVIVTIWTGSGIIGAVGGLVAWLLSVQIWWRKICRRCSGHPRFYDWASVSQFRPCPDCEGRGWVPRLFAVGR